MPQFIEGEVAQARAETGRGDGRSLLSQDAGRPPADLHFRSETGRTCRGGGRSNQSGRKRELVALDDYGVPRSLLLVRTDVPRCARPVDLTTGNVNLTWPRGDGADSSERRNTRR